MIAFLQNAELFTGAGSVEYITAKRVPIVGISGGEDWAGSSPMYFPHVPFGDALPRTALASTAQQLVPSGRTKLGTLVCVEAPACDGFDRSLAEAAKPLGFEPVYRARGSTAQPDYTAECLAAQSAGAQVIFVALDTNALGRIAAACARQGYRPVLSTFSTVAADAMKTDANLDGHMVASSPVFPYFQSGTPATDEFQQALRTLGRGLQVGVGTAVGWTAGKLMERATTALTEPPTSQAILAGLWSVKGDTLGGLGPPLSFTENRPPEAPGCWFNLALAGRTWRSPDANRLNCGPARIAVVGPGRKLLHPGLLFDRRTVEHERAQVVLADGEEQLQHDGMVVARRQRGPRAVRHARPGMELVGAAQEGRVVGIPTGLVRAAPYPVDLVVGDPDRSGDPDVLAPLVGAAAVGDRAQGQQLPVAGREQPVDEQGRPEGQPSLEQRRVMGHGGEDVEGAAVGARGEAGQELVGLG